MDSSSQVTTPCVYELPFLFDKVANTTQHPITSSGRNGSCVWLGKSLYAAHNNYCVVQDSSNMHVIWEALQQKSYIFADEYELLKYIIAWRRMMQTDAMHNERRWNNANESCASVWPYLLYVCNPDILYETPIYYNPDILYVCNPDILTAQVVLPHHGERASSC